MVKIRRNKRRTAASRSRNPKRELQKKRKKLFKSELEIVEKSWNPEKSAKKNLKDMGLSYDANITVSRAIKHPNQKTGSRLKGSKNEIAGFLEREAKIPRVKKLKFPKPQALYFTYLIKKYGDNYKEMAKDPKNVYQETWKKIRSRIKQFRTLEQYQKFMSGYQ